MTIYRWPNIELVQDEISVSRCSLAPGDTVVPVLTDRHVISMMLSQTGKMLQAVGDAPEPCNWHYVADKVLPGTNGKKSYDCYKGLTVWTIDNISCPSEYIANNIECRIRTDLNGRTSTCCTEHLVRPPLIKNIGVGTIDSLGDSAGYVVTDAGEIVLEHIAPWKDALDMIYNVKKNGLQPTSNDIHNMADFISSNRTVMFYDYVKSHFDKIVMPLL